MDINMDIWTFKMLNEEEQKSIILKELNKCVNIYKKELINKNILFLLYDKNAPLEECIVGIETKFRDNNFLHLTGVKYKKEIENRKGLASQFYYKILKNKVLPKDISIENPVNVYNKLSILSELFTINKNAKMLGSYDGTIMDKLYAEKVVGNVKFCLGLKKEDGTKYYRPVSSLKEDIRNITQNRLPVVCIFSKKTNEELYSNITYLSNDSELNFLSWNEKIADLIDISNLHSDNKANKLLQDKIQSFNEELKDFYEQKNNSEENDWGEEEF